MLILFRKPSKSRDRVRAVLDAVVKRKIPSPRRESNPSTPIVQPLAQRCTDWAIYHIVAKVSRVYTVWYGSLEYYLSTFILEPLM
jgi:hypothetical protein